MRVNQGSKPTASEFLGGSAIRRLLTPSDAFWRLLPPFWVATILPYRLFPPFPAFLGGGGRDVPPERLYKNRREVLGAHSPFCWGRKGGRSAYARICPDMPAYLWPGEGKKSEPAMASQARRESVSQKKTSGGLPKAHKSGAQKRRSLRELWSRFVVLGCYNWEECAGPEAGAPRRAARGFARPTRLGSSGHIDGYETVLFATCGRIKIN